jgi:sugar phosphate isomerase/epimerase
MFPEVADIVLCKANGSQYSHRGVTMKNLCLLVTSYACLGLALPIRADEKKVDAALFDPDNRVAWCIVPFDAKKRGPEERVAMLKRLGFKHYAYDWRAEHLPSFDRELQLLKKNDIELTAVWFPAELNADARTILELLKKHQVKTRLWVTMGDPAPGAKEQSEKVAVACKILRPIAEEAARIDCRVGLYNHGNWFGEPENQLAVLENLKLPNVGLVYNLHHGHDHLNRFPELLKKMQPHLYALNLNGMVPRGDRIGRKILPLGKGELDLELLRAIRDSGYKGRIGILGHTQDDAELRLLDNLDGLNWLVPQLDGKPAGPKPTYRTP